MEGEYETAPNLPNGTNFNDLEWSSASEATALRRYTNQIIIIIIIISNPYFKVTILLNVE